MAPGSQVGSTGLDMRLSRPFFSRAARNSRMVRCVIGCPLVRTDRIPRHSLCIESTANMNAPLKKLDELKHLAFDGVRSGYVPPRTLRTLKKLNSPKKATKETDPASFDVVRPRLWNVNEEHG